MFKKYKTEYRVAQGTPVRGQQREREREGGGGLRCRK
jgi:hypothetical protein